MGVVSLKGSLLLMAFLIHTVLTAPVIEENTALLGPDQIAEGKGCYYNYEHYDEGDRIMTNEPCLNCTCHNRMLMCYLRVCPFTKAIGQDCKVEKKPDQCCPVITCPQVPVALLTSSTTETTASTTTAVGHPDSYGCVLDDNIFYADGAQVPSDVRKPCELCYCIRNQTACVMQECTLNVEGCKPVYQEGVCCPVRYDCDYDEVVTTPGPTAGLVTTPGGPNECKANDQIYQDGEMINNMTENPCEHCYCMRGDVVCAVQECGTPLENTECTPMPAEPGQCCPNTYQCPNGTVPAHVLQATPNLKPSPPVAPSLAQIKPNTEGPTADDKIAEHITEATNDGQENENAGLEQQEPEKTERPLDSTVAESSEVITEAPKEQAIIEIITTAAPQDVGEEQTHGSPSEALQTGVEQHPETQQEISSVPEIVPEHDHVEEEHVEEHNVQEGHFDDGQDAESHDVEATTAPGHYTEISVENVEMNTSPPEKAKPVTLSATHSLDEKESYTVKTEQEEPTTVGPSGQLNEQLPQNANQEVSNQQTELDASGQPENQDEVSQPEHHEATIQEENQQTTSQPDAQGASIQPENQEITVRPEIQEVINQLDNQEASSQQEKHEAVQPENKDSSSQLVNQETTSQQEIVSSPTEPSLSITEPTTSSTEPTTSSTEPTPSSKIPQDPLPQEDEKPSAVEELPATTPAPPSSTTTTEAEPEEMSRIPGEGSCLHKGITYAPNTEVPSSNACKRCRCTNSIVQCNDVECPEPPISLYSNCVPMPPTDDACCPTYFCEQKPSQEPEVDNMSIDKIDQGVEEAAPEEGIAPTTVASVNEDIQAAHENFVPGTHEISSYTNPNVESGSQPESTISEDAEEVKPSGEGSQPESVIPLEEGSHPESDIPSEATQPELAVPSEVSQPESATEPQTSVDAATADTITAPPESPSDNVESASFDQHEESPAVPSEDVVSQHNFESESAHDAEATPTTTPQEIIPEEQSGKLEEAQSISEVPQTTAVDDQQLATESPQPPTGEEVSFNSLDESHTEPEHSLDEVAIEASTAQPEISKPLESHGAQDADPTNENLEDIVQTTVIPVHEESAHIESGQETGPQHGDITNPEGTNLQEAHDVQESVTQESSASGFTNTDAPNISAGEHEGAEHDDSVSSGSSQPSEAEDVPTIDQAENDLTATHDQSAPEPTTAIPETSSINSEYIEAQHPSTEGPSEASENPEISEPMVTSGPPVLFPDISHQGAPIHIPGPAGINTDGLTSEDERLGNTEAPIQEPSQTEQPQAPEESSSSGDMQQASEVSEGGIKDDNAYTTEGLNAISHQTEEAEGDVSGVASESGSGNNQITESSQTSEPGAHIDANEISPPDHEPSQGGDSQTEVSQPVTETPQEEVQHHDETEIQPTHDETEMQPTHDESEVELSHDDTAVQPTHDDSEAQQNHDETEAEHDESETQHTHDETEIHELPSEQHEGTEAPTHERPAEQQVETEIPSIPDNDVTEAGSIPTEAPQVPIVTHGDLPTPSEPSTDNIILPSSQTEQEKQPEPSTQQSQDTEVSASQPAAESHEHEQVDSESEHTQEVTQAPENDEVVTHIDSAGPQQVPEIANQVVETETNSIDHTPGLEHVEQPSAPAEDGKTETDEVAHTAEDHHEPIEQEQPLQPEEPQHIPEEHHPDVVPAEPQHPDVLLAEHQEHPEVVPDEHQEHPESDHVPTIEDHSEGHVETSLSGANTVGQNQELQTEQPAEQTLPELQQPEMTQTGEQSQSSTGDISEHSPSGEILPETLPEVAHDENQPEQPPSEEHLEQDPHPELTLVDSAETSHSDVTGQEYPQTTAIPEQHGPSEDSEVQPEQQNVVLGQQVDEETKPEHQEQPVTGDEQETTTTQASGAIQPITNEQIPQVDENQEHMPLTSHDSAPAAAGEQEVQTAAPAVGESVQTEDTTAAPDHSDVSGESQVTPAEAEKDGALGTVPIVQHGDQQETSHEIPATSEGQPNELTALSPEVPESEPSGSELPIQTPEELPVESGPSAPSAPESAPSAPESAPSAPETAPSAPESVVQESAAPEETSAPESIVPDLPSAPGSNAPPQPSAPEYTAPEQPSAVESEVQPSAPEQPVALETLPSTLGQDEVPVPQKSDSPSQPEQSSHLVEEIEKEQPAQETSSSPIAETPQSSPLPPVETPSTEGPVLPPGLQTWSQKPYHPPSLPEHQQHHHTAAEVPHIPEENHYPSQPYDQDYEDDDNVSYGPGTCRYGGKVYLSAQQIPRDDPCDFCFCFRSDIICLQQSCPPPIRGCYQETIKGFCCPRYECHVSMATMVNITTTSTTTTTTVPPHFLSHHYDGSAMQAGCQVKGIAYRVGDRIPSTSGPCLDCRCGADGQMKCDPTVCGPQESLLRQVMAASVSKRRRR